MKEEIQARMAELNRKIRTLPEEYGGGEVHPEVKARWHSRLSHLENLHDAMFGNW